MKTILVVHSERHMARLIQVNLQRAGFSVLVALDERDALRLLREQTVDLIVADWMLAELRAALRSHPATKDIPVLLVRPDGTIGR